MSNLEQRLHATNAFINIDGDRQVYAKHYETLRDSLYSELRKEPPLKNWLCGHKLGGSYADNLKITKPDEYDLVLHIKFPENNRIIVRRDPKKPGNVTLEMTEVLNVLQNQPHNEVTYTKLKTLVTDKNLLREDKLQDMIGGAVTRALNRMNNQITVNGKIAKIIYTRCGPAHTMNINEKDINYSVDFVPAIRLDSNQNVLGPEQRKYFKGIRFWEAIPKPLKPFQSNNVSFRASYSDAENVMLKDKNRLKDAIRFVKKFRDSHQNMSNLKSYYIKTILLWQVKEKPASYWSSQPLKDILIDMIRELKKSLATSNKNGKLPFFWDPELDLFAVLKKNQRDDMFNCVTSKLYWLERADGNLTKDIDQNVTLLFSTRQERQEQNSPINGNVVTQNPKPQERKTESEDKPNSKLNCALF